jgi:hypothetical protein
MLIAAGHPEWCLSGCGAGIELLRVVFAVDADCRVEAPFADEPLPRCPHRHAQLG